MHPSCSNKYDFGIHLAKMLALDLKLIHPISIEDRSDLTPRPCDMSLDDAKMVKIIPYCNPFSQHLSRLLHNPSPPCSN